jgi:hypothetical protein
LSSYINANKEFQDYIKTQSDKYTKNLNTKVPEELKPLDAITKDIQTLINKKIIETINNQEDTLEKTKDDMVKNFNNIDKDGKKEHELTTYLDKTS